MSTHTQKITPAMTIGDIFTSFPQKSQLLAQAMTQAGLHCTSCSAATWETLEAGMFGHGMTQAAIDQLVQKLNRIVEEELPPSSEQAYSIVLTPKAAQKFREFAREEGVENPSLRFGDTAGGCNGFQYVLDFSEGVEEKDAVFHSEGIEIHIKRGMLPRLTGCVIDYVDALQGAGFKISNPNVKSACACGTSQGY